MYSPYPEGTREKRLYSCPSPSPFKFLICGHKYLFKQSSHRYPEQFWTEVLAYQLGMKMGVQVPPTFVAINSDNGQCAALIEWFFEYPSNEPERYTPGGDFMQRLLPKYDRRKGGLHNFNTIRKFLYALGKGENLEGDWVAYWATTFTFDALIGNTDRHQDNWGIIWRFPVGVDLARGRLAPAFDNGTSMGHEIRNEDFTKFLDESRLRRYVMRGTHHMKWSLADADRVNHLAFLQRLCGTFPAAKEHMAAALLRVNAADMGKIAGRLTRYDVPVRFSEERADFVVRLLSFRHQWILEGLA